MPPAPRARAPPVRAGATQQGQGLGLIILKLLLPAAVRRPDAIRADDGRYACAGAVREGRDVATRILVEDKEDVVEVGGWEERKWGVDDEGSKGNGADGGGGGEDERGSWVLRALRGRSIGSSLGICG